MLEIPLEATPNQELLVTLDNQDCTIAVYQRGDNVYLDLSAGNTLVRQGAACLPRVSILGDAAGFSGRLYITDERSQPAEQQPPQWEGLGARWRLYWLTPDEAAALDEAKEAEARNG